MSYQKTGLNLSEAQKESIKNAYVNKKPVTLRLSSNQLSGNDFLGLTKAQHKKVITSRRLKRNVLLTLSKTQVSKQGGFLGGLANLVKMVAPFFIEKGVTVSWYSCS